MSQVAAVIKLDDKPLNFGEHKRSEQFREQYHMIGRLLNICEAGSFAAGVPWLPPTRAVRTLAKDYCGPLSRMVRLSLLSVSTNVLESYCEDLEPLFKERNTDICLYIRPLSIFERSSFPASVFVAIFFLTAALLFSAGLPFLNSSLAVAAAASLLAMSFCIESQRRYSFYNILYRELLRRKGIDNPNKNRIGIIPAETNSLTK